MAVSDYINLVIPEHRNKSKFIAWLTSALKIEDDTNTFLKQLNANFNIDAATGAQLDTIGQILNTSRIVPFQLSAGTPDNPSFVWGTPLENEAGWGKGYWQPPKLTARLDDDNYRLLLKAAAAKAHWSGSIVSLENMLNYIFSNSYITHKITDNQDMTFSVAFSGSFSATMRDLLEHDFIVPRPEGVALIVSVTESAVIITGAEASTVDTQYSYVISGGAADTSNYTKVYKYLS